MTKRYVEDDLNGGFGSITQKSLAARVITDITEASPAVVTSVAHGLAAGDAVDFAAVGGMTEINGLTATIASVTTDTFTTNIAAAGFTAYTTGGTATPNSPLVTSGVRVVYDDTLSTKTLSVILEKLTQRIRQLEA